jgi:hypothetical protein
MDTNSENIFHKITNLLKKYKHGMTCEEIQLAMTSQWLRISDFSHRPINLQLKLFWTLLQFTTLAKDVVEGPKCLGIYFGKLLNTLPVNSVIWIHSRSIGSSLALIIHQIAKSGEFLHHTLSLNNEGMTIHFSFNSSIGLMLNRFYRRHRNHFPQSTCCFIDILL